MIVFSDIIGMLKTGFSQSTVGFALLMYASFMFWLTGLVPAFRRCYYRLPWLYPFNMILTMDLAILSIAETILSIGFSEVSTTRHVVAVILMVLQLVGCRIAMCIYLKKNPMVLHKYDRAE